jgi:hypothetical protein
VIEKLLYAMTPEAFARWQQHLNKFRLRDSLVCDLFLEDPTVYNGEKVDLEKTTPDSDEHVFRPSRRQVRDGLVLAHEA